MSNKTRLERAEICREDCMADRVSDGAYIGDAILALDDTARAGVAAMGRIAAAMERPRWSKHGANVYLDGVDGDVIVDAAELRGVLVMGEMLLGKVEAATEPGPTGYPPTLKQWVKAMTVVDRARVTWSSTEGMQLIDAFDAAMKEELAEARRRIAWKDGRAARLHDRLNFESTDETMQCVHNRFPGSTVCGCPTCDALALPTEPPADWQPADAAREEA